MKNDDNFGKTGLFQAGAIVPMRSPEDAMSKYGDKEIERIVGRHIEALLASISTTDASITIRQHKSEWTRKTHPNESDFRKTIHILAYFNNPEDAQIGDLCDIKTIPTNFDNPKDAQIGDLDEKTAHQYFDPKQFRWKNENITLYRRTA